MAQPRNPFRTAPGSEPPALAGRDDELSATRLAGAATAAGEPAQPIVFTGLRGMGKTSLLRYSTADLRAGAGIIVAVEAIRGEPLTNGLARTLERARRELEPLGTRVRDVLDAMLATLPSATFKAPGDLGEVEIAAHRARHHDKTFLDLLDELNDRIRERDRYLVLAVDEIQDGAVDELRTIVRYVHESAGSARPVLFLAAGLPNAPEHLHDVRTYTERWRFFRLHLLTPEQTAAAIAVPLERQKISIEPSALDLLVKASTGYPYFVQEYASAAWLVRSGSEITADDVAGVIPGVRRTLEDTFYDSRFRKLTARECAYVLAMSSLGDGPHTSGEVGRALRRTSEQISSIRRRLIEKDVVYAPASGLVEFRIPLTRDYVERHRAQLARRASGVDMG